MSLRRTLHVFDEFNRIVLDVNRERAEALVRRGQAYWIAHRQAVRLAAHYLLPEHPCRTHTSRGPLLGAIGRSQCYTIDDARGRVTGFKFLAPEDRSVFHQATLDCMGAT